MSLDKHELEKLLRQKNVELEEQRKKLNEMYSNYEKEAKSLTDEGILKQSQECTSISLELALLKEQLEGFEE